jgi:long-chain acyl-CoA synthetase
VGTRSLPVLLFDRIAATPDAEAFRVPPTDGAREWRSLSWREVGQRVRAMACGLSALGLLHEARAAILSSTRLEWILADFAIVCAGGATTTIYPSSVSSECAFILEDSQSMVAFAENAAQVDKLVAVRAQLPALQKVIVLDGPGGHDGWVIPLAELEALGRAHDAEAPERYEAEARRIPADALATLIYTSGTTGRPKGVELTHDCWVYEAEAVSQLGIISGDDVQYLWLPLAHAFGKVLVAAQVVLGIPTAVDGRADQLVPNLAAVRPTFVAAVPRVFEKVHNVVVMSAGGTVQHALFRWAFSVGGELARRKQKGEPVPLTLLLAHAAADRLVLSRIRQRFGGRLRFFICGSAPLSREIGEFFHAAGIPLLEGYGLTESSAASFVNRLSGIRFGTVGQPLPGTEVKIAPGDGEVLLRGRGIMRGYHALAEATRDTLDADGWLRTGDIGELDAEGFLRITDRKKDLIKTSGGKYIAPQAIEGKLKAACPYLSQVVVHGDNRKYVSALVTLDDDAMHKWALEHGRTNGNLAADPAVRALVQGYIDRLNTELPKYEAIRKFAILPRDLSLEAGELTASLKVKRKVVEERYRAVLDGMYEDAVAAL